MITPQTSPTVEKGEGGSPEARPTVTGSTESRPTNEECPIPPDGIADEEVRAEWRAVCTVLQTVRIHEAGEAWHRESAITLLGEAARRWNLATEDGPFAIRQALEDLLVKLSLRLAASEGGAQ